MKKVIAIIVILLPFAAFAQYAPYHPPGEDLEYMTDYQWNNWTRGFTVDGVFVKNLIGLPLNIVRKKEINYPFTITKIGPEKDTMVVSVDPRKTELGYINIRGFRCTQLTDYDSNNTSLCFMTLDEVRETYCPEVKGKVLYMINKFFVMKNAELYRIERLNRSLLWYVFLQERHIIFSLSIGGIEIFLQIRNEKNIVVVYHGIALAKFV